MLFYRKLLIINILSLLCFISGSSLNNLFAQKRSEKPLNVIPATKDDPKKPIQFKDKDQINLKWTGKENLQIPNGENIEYLSFAGAGYKTQENFLPYYTVTRELSGTEKIRPVLINATFESFTSEEIKNVKDLNRIQNEIIFEQEEIEYRKKDYLKISFIPIRKNPSNGQLEKLVSFKLNFEKDPSGSRKPGNHSVMRNYASQSVLNIGKWYKLGLNQDGVYRLDKKFLENIGIDVAAIDPRSIKIFGNGGEILPFKNSSPRYDDLRENSIRVVGEEDGRFDSTDYVIFYGQSPHKWKQFTDNNCPNRKFAHEYHLYSDSTFYFLTYGQGYGKRVQNVGSVSTTPTVTITDFDDHQYHEKELYNFIKSGRNWYGELFDNVTSMSFNFNFPNIITSVPVTIKANVTARCITCTSSYTFKANGQTIGSVTVQQVPALYYGDYINQADFCGSFSASSPNLQLALQYNKNGSSTGYLNYIEVFAKRSLYMDGNQMHFRNLSSAGAGNVSEFVLGNTTPNLEIWDITDPLSPFNQQGIYSGYTTTIRTNTDSLKEFIAFNGLNYLTPVFAGNVANQNLHAINQADLIIIAHPKFYNDALELADLHKTNDTLNTVVVTTEQIYNEFSSGSVDVTAIKDFVKMLYDRNSGNLLPKYVQLYGDGSYDNKSMSATNTNYIPTYQSANSYSPTGSYVSEDYFGVMGNNEGDNLSDATDLGIGRLPVKNASESKAVLTKIKNYMNPSSPPKDENTSGPSCNADLGSTQYGLGDWRNIICFIADDQDVNTHLNQADYLASIADTANNNLNLDKIYLDAYKQEVTAGGQRYPEVNEAINRRVQKGALIVNYTGHGGEVGWALERILDVPTINSWTNKDALPFFVTATCEFSRFDDPERNSAGELVILNGNGGGIGLLTTTRLVYASYNFELNTNFYEEVFKETNGQMPRLGDVTMLTKLHSTASVNNKNFTLLGDPALRLAYPKYTIKTTSINSVDVETATDTVKALQLVTVKGQIVNENGIKLSSFNGVVYPTVYDKSALAYTLANDAQGSGNTDYSMVRSFKVQKNILFKGKASVTSGEFTFQFIVPKDIAYNFDFGRISYYAENGKMDAAGFEERFVIGGYDPNAAADNTGPEIKLFMNDEKFVMGGLTNESPIIYTILSDEHGINTVGNGIGHDIVAVLDDNTEKSIVLNEYYQSDMNSYQKGKVKYKLSGLSDGKHTLKLKAWDVYNNSSDAYTEFIVSTSAELALRHVLNYPNPFTTKTSFYFEHNKPCSNLNVQIQVFTVSGKLVKNIEYFSLCDGFRSGPIEWDGLDDFGDQLARGVYIYRVKVRSQDGDIAEKFEKLVLLR